MEKSSVTLKEMSDCDFGRSTFIPPASKPLVVEEEMQGQLISEPPEIIDF